MTTIKKTKLGLHRETLVELQPDALAAVAGGFADKDGLSGRTVCPTQCNVGTIGCGGQP